MRFENTFVLESLVFMSFDLISFKNLWKTVEGLKKSKILIVACQILKYEIHDINALLNQPKKKLLYLVERRLFWLLVSWINYRLMQHWIEVWETNFSFHSLKTRHNKIWNMTFFYISRMISAYDTYKAIYYFHILTFSRSMKI